MHTTRLLAAILLILLLSSVIHAQGLGGSGNSGTSDPVYLRPVSKHDGAWYSNQIIGGARGVYLVGVRDATECERRQVEFTFLTTLGPTGDAKTVPVRGQWVQQHAKPQRQRELRDIYQTRVNVQSDTGGVCTAWLLWRLSDNPGRNYLRARIQRNEQFSVTPAVADSTVYVFRAIGHAPPAIVVGLARTVPRSATDSTSGGAYAPILGVDLPIVFNFLPDKAQEVLNRLRPMVATHYSHPGADLYGGLELFPLIAGARASANPFQLSAGRRWDRDHVNDSWFIAAHYNTTNLLGAFLGAIH